MDRCTCGAVLVEDAMFCHKCGRPVRELTPVEDAEPEPVAPPVVLPAPPLSAPPLSGQKPLAHPPLIGFGNPIAVRTSILVAGLCSLASLAPVPSLFVIFWRLVVLVAAGFLAVHLYQRRTGQWLSLQSGVRLGWMTGFFTYLIAALLSVTAMAVIASSKGGLAEFWRSQVAEYSNGADSQEALRILESNEGLAMLIALTFAVAFVIFTLLPMIGAALGAKVLEKE